MEICQNLGRDSGVSAFLIDDNSITVEFSDLEQMKILALSGKELNGFMVGISRKDLLPN
ncbi:hypothetical protein SAMN04488122_4786 [Chitinophaga arvensicola]|uniref:Uncharacterized protein n=1 Tax=Chitinophaga arvensicola TaxID=29529 RepID=A0A1I0S8D0_9BACT|nr:hypothetical protein SAMN04488122_4786 [Chitinophaga arvensicola]